MCIEKKIISRAEAETENCGSALAAELPRGSVVLLRGDLGAGKTVFARGFARGLGVMEYVSSPTYTIVQEYELPSGGRLYHLDLYRISGVAAALDFGVDEFLSDRNSYSLVEWPERLETLLPENAVTVDIRHIGESEREIHICKQ